MPANYDEHSKPCAECGEITHEDDLCPCESFCPDCHESHISPACEDVDTDREAMELDAPR